MTARPRPASESAVAPSCFAALAAALPLGHQFDILGRRYAVRTDLPEAIPPLLHRLEGFLARGRRAAGPRPPYLLCSRQALAAAHDAPGAGRFFLVAGERALGFTDVGLLVYWGEGTLLLDVMADAADTVFFHAAAVSEGAAGAALLAGEGGAGKTMLALEFLARGWRVSSDDFCPVTAGTLDVVPFPRGVCVKGSAGGGPPRLPARLLSRLPGVRARLGEPPDVAWAGERLWFCPVLADPRSRPLPARAVFLLYRRPGRARLFSLAPEEVAARLARLTPGRRRAPRDVLEHLSRRVAGHELHYNNVATAADAVAEAMAVAAQGGTPHGL